VAGPSTKIVSRVAGLGSTSIKHQGCATKSFGEAELMAVRIFHVEVSLAPRGIFGRFQYQCLCVQQSVERIEIIYSKNHSAPPTLLICCTRDQIDERFPGSQTTEGRILAAYTSSNPSFR